MAGALIATTTNRIGDFAMLLGVAGGLVLAWGAAAFLKGPQNDLGRRRERIRTLIGGLLIGVAFLVLFTIRVSGS
jgi:membrane protease YdiL (CAAX protease family)